MGGLATGALSAVEMGRTLLRAQALGRDIEPTAQTTVLSALAHISLSPRAHAVATQIGPPVLRFLDAIHLACALALGRDLGALMPYDDRLAAAAHHQGIVSLVLGLRSLELAHALR